jgi:RNA polymerase sigma-70 factor (ECF subfamily)
VRVWEHPQGFDVARGSWRGWLGVMTHRRAVDWGRRSAAACRRNAAAAALPVAAPDPEAAAVAGSVAKSVRAALEDLPAAQGEAVRLAYLMG